MMYGASCSMVDVTCVSLTRRVETHSYPPNTNTRTRTHTNRVAQIHQKQASFAGRGIRNLMLTDCQNGLASQEIQYETIYEAICLNCRSMYCFSHPEVFAGKLDGHVLSNGIKRQMVEEDLLSL